MTSKWAGEKIGDEHSAGSAFNLRAKGKLMQIGHTLQGVFFDVKKIKQKIFENFKKNC